MGFSVTFDEPSSTVRVKHSGDDCEVVDAMDAFASMHADARFRDISKLLVDLNECHAEVTPLEVEAFAEFLGALFHGHALAFVTSVELVPHLAYATDILGRDGRIDARVFGAAQDAETWLRAVN